MVLLQFRVENATEEEYGLLPDFCEWLGRQVILKINTKINRRKIGLRLKYMQEEASWIDWKGVKKYDTSVNEIMNTIIESVMYEPHRLANCFIKINPNYLIPNSNTSIDRLVRFINYGDMNFRATGMFTSIQTQFKHKELQALWLLYITKHLGTLTNAKIISE